MDGSTRAELQLLMTRLAAGDRGAFDPLFALLRPCVRAFVGGQLPPADAEDVAQEALLELFSRASAFDPREGDATSWALAIAAFEVRTFRTRARRRREDPGAPSIEEVDPSPGPDEAALQHELAQAAREVLGTLRPSDLETLSAMARGERPRIPAATFRKRVERALRRFKLAWSARHAD